MFFFSKLDTRKLQCDCHFFESIWAYINSTPQGGSPTINADIWCAAPKALESFGQFRNRAELERRKRQFICSK